jgi:hypothetical protein
MNNELIHDHMSYHHDSEKGKKNRSNYPGPLRTSLEDKDAIEKRGSEKMH